MDNLSSGPALGNPAEPAPPALSRRARIYAAHGLLPATRLSHHLRLAALSSADHDRYLSQQADQRRAETIATIDADLVWQQAQGAI